MKILSKVLGFTVLLALLTASSCQIVGGIFKAGYYTALILVFVVILLILFLIGYFRKK